MTNTKDTPKETLVNRMADRDLKDIVWELVGLMLEMSPYDEKDARNIRLIEINEELKNIKTHYDK